MVSMENTAPPRMGKGKGLFSDPGSIGYGPSVCGGRTDLPDGIVPGGIQRLTDSDDLRTAEETERRERSADSGRK